MKTVTLRDIARQTNLDVSTVSRVLNNDKAVRITPERREEVLRVADELGYVPHRSARSLRLNRSFNIGYMLSDLEFPLARLRLYGLVERLEQNGYLISLMHTTNPDLLERKTLRRQLVEGLVWNCYVSSPQVDEKLHRTHLPIALIDPFGLEGRHIENASVVAVDRVEGVRRALEYLRARGHRCIAFVSARTNVLRLAGYRLAVQEMGLSDDPRLIRLYDSGTEHPINVRGYGHRMTMHLLESGVAFTAVQAGNDTTAAGIIDALREAGRRVPEDVAVIGYDDVEEHHISLFTKPFLTTLRDPNYEMGVKAAEVLMEMIERGSPAQRITLEPTLVVRESA